MWDVIAVRARLEALRREGVARTGSENHGFELRPTLSLDDVERFEELHQVRLPEEYREFLLELGDGGAGPFGGVFSLVDRQRIQLDHLDVPGFLQTAFPHSTKWRPDEPVEPLEGESDADFEAREQRFDEWYFEPDRVFGSLAVAYNAYGDTVRLVVTGPERGMLWDDGRSNMIGLFPRALTFQQWYEDWLRFPGNPTGEPTRPRTPDELKFVVACKQGDVDIARTMLAETRTELVVRGLYFTAFDAQVEVARLLLDHGVPADRPDEAGNTPLMMAGQGPGTTGRPALVQLLLDRGADGLRRDGFGRDLLFLLTHQPDRADLETAEVLVRWAAARTAADPDEMSRLLPGKTWMLDDLVAAVLR